MKEYIMRERGIDRAGRTIFDIYERSGEKRYYSVGKLWGTFRYDEEKEQLALFERIEDCGNS